uniref:Uncharacterized protein n=1 Tax=Solanum lycopersicum TaxID=4081 RepID=A0A3Q7GKQ7_SOLLC
MLFGLCSAPATFQRRMMSIFSDMMEDTVEVRSCLICTLTPSNCHPSHLSRQSLQEYSVSQGLSHHSYQEIQALLPLESLQEYYAA